MEKIYHAQLIHRLLSKYLLKEGDLEDKEKGECLPCIQELLEELSADLMEIMQYVAIDPLLRVYTRSVFPHIKQREEELCRRNGLPLSVLFIDMDNLKKINDCYGHEAGDRVLQRLVGVVVSSIRRADLVIRWGGDEFVVLLHSTEQGAIRVKNRILDRLRDTKIHVEEEGIKAEIRPEASIGVAEAVSDDGEIDIEKAIKIADIRMYKEKREKKVLRRKSEEECR